MHQAVGQFAIGGEQQQATGVHVQTANGNPARAAQFWQAIKHRRAPFRIVAGAQLAFRLIVSQHATDLLSRLFHRDQMTIDTNF